MGVREVGATTDVDQWSFQENYVERLMDNAAFTAAHPNNTLVLAGPARFSQVENVGEDLKPVGMVQNMNVNQQRQVQPHNAVGSARTYFTASKSRVQFQIQRLLLNGRNLLRSLYTQAASNLDDVNLMHMGEPPTKEDSGEQFFLNLDSELFYVPFGMAVLFRSVAHDAVGAFYIELCMLNSYRSAVQGGQSMVMENVAGMADRIRPIFPRDLEDDQASSFTGYTRDEHPNSTILTENLLGQEKPSTPDWQER